MANMHNEGLFIETPTAASAAIMKTLWVVKADETYNVVIVKELEDNYILIRTLNGSGRIILKTDSEFTLAANSILLVRYQDIACYYTVDPLWEFSWFEFSAVPLLPLNTLVQQPVSGTEAVLCRELKKCMRQPGRKNSAAASAVLAALLHMWSVDTETAASRQRTKVRRLIEYMHRNLSNNISVAEMAQNVEMSERGLRKMFILATGIPPKKYYDQLRMSYARELLRSGQCDVAGAANVLKYSNAFSFSTAFKNATGSSPSLHISNVKYSA